VRGCCRPSAGLQRIIKALSLSLRVSHDERQCPRQSWSVSTTNQRPTLQVLVVILPVFLRCRTARAPGALLTARNRVIGTHCTRPGEWDSVWPAVYDRPTLEARPAGQTLHPSRDRKLLRQVWNCSATAGFGGLHGLA
jgi:hypothetical protein